MINILLAVCWVLRTIPPFVAAHTFCTSRVVPRNSGFLRTLSKKRGILLCEKARSKKGPLESKENWRQPSVIKAQFGEKSLTLVCTV